MKANNCIELSLPLKAPGQFCHLHSAYFHAVYKACYMLSSDPTRRLSVLLRGKKALCGLRLKVYREEYHGIGQSRS